MNKIKKKMNKIPKRIFLQVGKEKDNNIDFAELHDVTWSAERIYKTDIEYILKHAKAKKSVWEMAKETNDRSRACRKCKYLTRCTPEISEICCKAFERGYTKGYKQGRNV